MSQKKKQLNGAIDLAVIACLRNIESGKMELFSREVDATRNLLPKGGLVHYHGKVFSTEEANRYYKLLLQNIAWEHDQAVIFGKKIITKPKVAWYAENPYPNRYTGTEKIALAWTEELIAIKQAMEKVSGETYNSCLLNLYHTGEEGMAWHSDDEKELALDSAIASVSLGAERKFALKHKETKEKVEVWLEHGSLLVMKGATQTNWVHRLPPTKKIHDPRVNLTFRKMNEVA